jgi:hypothetical protein
LILALFRARHGEERNAFSKTNQIRRKRKT